MNDSIELAVRWTKVGVVTGFLACVVYPLLIAVPMPMTLTVLLAAVFGPLLSVASIGLYHFIGVGLLVLNLLTFPVPPADAGSIDLGPLVGVWYLAVTIMIARSLKWLKDTQNRED
jgi:hypothetical protein